jgi:hypothetical protein
MTVHCVCDNDNRCAGCRQLLWDRKLNANFFNETDGQIWHVPGFCALYHQCYSAEARSGSAGWISKSLGTSEVYRRLIAGAGDPDGLNLVKFRQLKAYWLIDLERLGPTGFIPYQIEATNKTLAGFPVNVLFAGLRPTGYLDTTAWFSACYHPDAKTYSEHEGVRKLTYFSSEALEYRLEVTLNTRTAVWETRKYKGSRLVRCAGGPDFRNAMLHTTIGGPEAGEGLMVDIRSLTAKNPRSKPGSHDERQPGRKTRGEL